MSDVVSKKRQRKPTAKALQAQEESFQAIRKTNDQGEGSSKTKTPKAAAENHNDQNGSASHAELETVFDLDDKAPDPKRIHADDEEVSESEESEQEDSEDELGE
jgi:hypothetical protein